MTVESHMTPYDDAYPSCERAVAELRVYPGVTSPESVTRQLGIEPTSAERAGEVFRNSLGRERVARLNCWFLSSEGHCPSRDIRRHLDWLLEKLCPTREALIALQEWPGIRMAIYCIWWSAQGGGGPVLWPEQMSKLGELNLECGFELSFYGDND
ncbi:DUF4279 domain-containing protein [Myxococcota bacterium]